MANEGSLPAALAIDGLGADARGAFDIAAGSRYAGISFATNHPELKPERLEQSGRRHLKTLLAGKHLHVDAIRVAGPRGGLAETESIDRTLDNARKAFLLASDLGVKTVSINLGNLAAGKVPQPTIVAALRDLAQHADAAGLILALGSEGSQGVRALIKDLGYDLARVHLDGARLIGAGEDPLKVAEEMEGVIGQVTAADAVRAGHTLRATYLGEGQLPVPEWMEILQEQGFHGPLVVDVRDLPDGAEGARHAAMVLKRVLQR